MTFDRAIDEIRKLTDDSVPVVLWKKGGNWNLDYTSVPAVNSSEWLDTVRKNDDPYAVLITNNDFSYDNHDYVYDKMLVRRFYAEAYAVSETDSRHADIHALAGFLDENIDEFSYEATTRLPKLNRPLEFINANCKYDFDPPYEDDFKDLNRFIDEIEQKLYEKFVLKIKKPFVLAEIADNKANIAKTESHDKSVNHNKSAEIE